MELERFGRLLVMHGADLRDWPEGERREAELLLAWSSEALRLRDEAARIDSVLRAAGPAVSPETIERVLARLETIPTIAAVGTDSDFAHGLFGGLPPPIRRPWIPVALLATMAIIGFLIGGAEAPAESRQTSDLVDLLMNRSMGGFEL